MRSYGSSKGSGSSLSEKRRYYLSLGSNLGNPAQNLVRAARSLECRGVRIKKKSSIYRTEPVGRIDQPWFTNQVIAVETVLTPWELLRLAKSIEAEMGRRPGPRHGPRPLDIDILLADRAVLKTPDLEIPHPRLSERHFILVPFAEIAPRLIHPLFRKTIRRLLGECPDRSAVVRLRSQARLTAAGAPNRKSR